MPRVLILQVTVTAGVTAHPGFSQNSDALVPLACIIQESMRVCKESTGADVAVVLAIEGAMTTAEQTACKAELLRCGVVSKQYLHSHYHEYGLWCLYGAGVNLRLCR